MSTSDFNAVSGDQNDSILENFADCLKSLPHKFKFSGGSPLFERATALKKTEKRLTKLQENIASYPDSLDSDDWRDNALKLEKEILIERSSIESETNAAADDYLSENLLKTIGVDRKQITRIDDPKYRGSLYFYVTAPLSIYFLTEKNFELVEYNPESFSDLRTVSKVTAQSFRELVAYLRSLNVPGHDFNNALNNAVSEQGFIAEIENAQTPEQFTQALSKGHRNNEYSGFDSHIDFHFTRALLAARASWKQDHIANNLFRKLDIFLQRPGKISSGVMSNCIEDDCIRYIGNLFSEPSPVLDSAVLLYEAQIGISYEEQDKIKQDIIDSIGPDYESKVSRLAECITLYNAHHRDPDFVKSCAAWKEEAERLHKQVDSVAIQNKANAEIKEAAEKRFEETKAAIINFIHDKKLGIDPENDLICDPANYSSSYELQIRATASDIRALQTIPQMTGVWIRRNEPHWPFVYKVNGCKEKFRDDYDIPGVAEYAPTMSANAVSPQPVAAPTPL